MKSDALFRAIGEFNKLIDTPKTDGGLLRKQLDAINNLIWISRMFKIFNSLMEEECIHNLPGSWFLVSGVRPH